MQRAEAGPGFVEQEDEGRRNVQAHAGLHRLGQQGRHGFEGGVVVLEVALFQQAFGDDPLVCLAGWVGRRRGAGGRALGTDVAGQGQPGEVLAPELRLGDVVSQGCGRTHQGVRHQAPPRIERAIRSDSPSP